MNAPSYVIVLADGGRVRTVRPEDLGDHRMGVDQALAAALSRSDDAFSAEVAERLAFARSALSATGQPAAGAAPHRADNPTLTQGEIAQQSGFSGNACRSCGSFNMVRTGTCETCRVCSETSGGCS